MNFALAAAASLAAALAGWYLLGLVDARVPRGVLRASVVALLCSPGILIGHGFAVVPSLVALAVQPSVYTLVPMLAVWLGALGAVFGVSALRDARSTWPPSVEGALLAAYPVKFVLLGVVATALMLALSYQHPSVAWKSLLRYGVFLAGAALNLVLCYHAVRARRARPYLVPLAFTGPAFLGMSPVVPAFWYAGGVAGSLLASGRRRSAAAVAGGAFALLAANALFRVYLAATAAPHVTIGGGVAGNLAIAALFAVAGAASWRVLARRA